MRRAWTVLSGFGLAGFLLWLSAVPASAAPTIGFDATAPIAVSASDPGTAAIVNDTTVPYRLLSISAPLIDSKGAPGPQVAISSRTTGGYTAVTDGLVVPAGGVLALQLTAAAASTPSSGYLTVLLSSGKSRLVLHRPVNFKPPTAVPAETSRTELARAGVGSWNGRGSATLWLPLSSGTCAQAGLPPTATLADGEHTVTLTPGCDPDKTSLVKLRASGIPQVGDYKGTLPIGGQNVSIELQRGLGPLWPIVMIVIGLGLAVVVQGITDRGWIRQQRGWIRRMGPLAVRAGKAFETAGAQGHPWAAYDIASYADNRAQAAGADIEQVITSRPKLLRHLPWPVGYQATRRADITNRLVDLDALIAGWASTAAVFATVQRALTGAGSAAAATAPELTRRVKALLAAEEPDLAVAAAQIGSASAALALVERVRGQARELHDLNAKSDYLSPSDQELLGTAWQQHRVAAAALAEVVEPDDAMARVAPLVSAAAVSIAALPRAADVTAPDATVAYAGPPLSSGRVIQQTGVIGQLAFNVLSPVRAARTFITEAMGPATNLLLFVFNLTVAVWTGLVFLYLGKTWGTGVDFVTAVAWGFGASTVLTPLLNVIQSLATRPSDATKSP